MRRMDGKQSTPASQAIKKISVEGKSSSLAVRAERKAVTVYLTRDMAKSLKILCASKEQTIQELLEPVII